MSKTDGTAQKTDRKPRETRSNHAAAKTIPITDVASAQKFVTQVLKDTATADPQSMFNGSGFVAPGALALQDPETLLRMSCAISNALASQTVDPQISERANAALRISNEFGRQAVEIVKQRALDAAKALIEASGGKVQIK